MRARVGSWLAVLLVGFNSVGLLAQAPAPGQIAKSGRWLIKGGLAEPYPIVGIDAQELAADPSLDYSSKLSAIRDAGFDKIRIWIDPWFGGCNFLTPVQVNCASIPAQFQFGPTGQLTWNSAYWSRLRSFLTGAGFLGLSVEITIFAPNNLDTASEWQGTNFPNMWNNAYNTISAWLPNAESHFIPDFFDLERQDSGYFLEDYQQSIVSKVMAEIGAKHNVFFEITNEFPLGGSKVEGGPGTGGFANNGCRNSPSSPDADADDPDVRAWHNQWITNVANSTSKLVAAHAQQGWGPNVEGIQYYWNNSNIDLLSFHFYNDDPQCISDLLHSAQLKAKVLSNNESDNYRNSNGSLNTTKLDNEMRLAWGMLLSGGYFNLYEDDSSLIGDAAFAAAATRLRAMKSVWSCFKFRNMSPVRPDGTEVDDVVIGGPSSAWQVLSQDASQYLVYYWTPPGQSKSTNPARIYLPSGTYEYRWFDARNAATLATSTISGGALRNIPSPPTGSWNGNSGLALTVRVLSQAGTCGPPV